VPINQTLKNFQTPQMSPELQAAARKLAEGGEEGSLTSKVGGTLGVILI
jgi:hypothetical protein